MATGVGPDLPGPELVRLAQQKIRDLVLRTPVVNRPSFDEEFGARVWFKCENQQRTGSFKFRGASHAVLSLERDARQHGVVTHSSGNHGAALALAAREQGLESWIIVPVDANPLKRDAIARYGGKIVDCGPTLDDREAMLAEVRAQTGARFVPPYDDEHIIAGQGTAALELLESCAQLDELWVPVGGGGLASGTVLALAGSQVRVAGGEPALADDAYRSLARGRRLPQRPPRTVADGLRTSLGSRNFEILRAAAFDIELVSEDEIVMAQRWLWERLKLVVEPSGAVPLAALARRIGKAPERYRTLDVGVILSGGNVAFPELSSPEPSVSSGETG